MKYSGKSLSVEVLASGAAKLTFDLSNSSVNKFNKVTLEELRDAVFDLKEADVTGLIFASAKSAFIVGADITEFTGMFASSESEITEWLSEGNQIFNDIEDLPYPTVTTINGVALGGGFEMALATDFRVGAPNCVVGFPEVKLGILPGFGGTVRLPRLLGADNANQWISSGAQIRSKQALAEGALDAIVESEKLISAAEDLIAQCNEGKFNIEEIRHQKTSPLKLPSIELSVAYETAIGMVSGKAGPHYPAPLTSIKVMRDASTFGRAEALKVEHQGFLQLAKTKVAANLVQMFLNDQHLSNSAKSYVKSAGEVKSAGVLGAGIMGGGIAYQSALKGTPILMKDIAQEGLDLGMMEASKLLNKQLARGRIDSSKLMSIMSSISPSLSYDGFEHADIVVEAIVENLEIKKSVLAELETVVDENAIIASNTSTISIDALSVSLQRPEKFCGMHFFNPVPVMPLVEVIRGAQTSDSTIAATVAFAKKMGKKPIVVNNCPGFLVNRILFPYFGAFSRLIYDGADFNQIDRAMEKFGWPMGPAYLLDVIGIDTAVHCQDVMASGFSRMNLEFESAIDKLYAQNNLGQKTGKGFYSYEIDKKGKPKKLPNPDIDQLVRSVQVTERKFTDEEIVERMMVAMCIETARCLEDRIVETSIEADMGLILGVGFPAFRGGALRYIDSVGLDSFCRLTEKYQDLGELYRPTMEMEGKAEAGDKYYK